MSEGDGRAETLDGIIPEDMRSSGMNLFGEPPKSQAELEVMLVRYLDYIELPVTLADLNRRFGQLSRDLAGRSLGDLVAFMERRGALATRFSRRRKKTYVYGPESWVLFKETAQATENVSFFDNLEEQADPLVKRPSGAQRRKAKPQSGTEPL